MRQVPVFITLALLLLHPTTAYTFEPVSYTQNGFQIIASVEAEVPWQSPFNQEINISVTVVPQVKNVTEVALTSLLVTVHATEADRGYLLITSKEYSPPVPAIGVENVSILTTLSIAGSGIGEVCYFGISVEGAFTNSTGTYGFSTISPENLVGPFAILMSIGSPQFLVGLAFIILFLVVTAAGVSAARRTRARPKRRPLLEE